MNVLRGTIAADLTLSECLQPVCFVHAKGHAGFQCVAHGTQKAMLLLACHCLGEPLI